MRKAILFDLDGLVIVSKGRLFSERFAEENNIPIGEVREFFINNFRECSFGRADLKEKVAPFLVKWGYSGTVDDFLNYWFTTESTLDVAVISFITDIRATGVPCYIATRQEKYRKEYLLNVLGLKDKFDGIFCTCDIGYDKWQKEYWDYVCRKLNIKPEEITFFCDSEKNIESSKVLGVQSYLYEGIDTLKVLR